jgi:hypothetical protein
MAYLKKDAPPDVVETLRQAEAQADECWRGLQLLQNPSNTALWFPRFLVSADTLWVLLTGGIGMVEREQTARGSNTPHFDPMLIHVSR